MNTLNGDLPEGNAQVNAADDGRKYHDENEIHHSAFTSLDDQFALRAYLAFI